MVYATGHIATFDTVNLVREISSIFEIVTHEMSPQLIALFIRIFAMYEGLFKNIKQSSKK